MFFRLTSIHDSDVTRAPPQQGGSFFHFCIFSLPLFVRVFALQNREILTME
jgi:hypothetical protein